MKYFTEKKNMMNELMEVLNDDCNYNIDISQERVNIDGKICKMWGLRVTAGKNNLEDIENLLYIKRSFAEEW